MFQSTAQRTIYCSTSPKIEELVADFRKKEAKTLCLLLLSKGYYANTLNSDHYKHYAC